MMMLTTSRLTAGGSSLVKRLRKMITRFILIVMIMTIMIMLMMMVIGVRTIVL